MLGWQPATTTRIGTRRTGLCRRFALVLFLAAFMLPTPVTASVVLVDSTSRMTLGADNEIYGCVDNQVQYLQSGRVPRTSANENAVSSYWI